MSASLYCKDLGMLLLGHDRDKYPFVILRQTKIAHFGRPAYSYIGKAATQEDAQALAQKQKQEKTTIVLVKNLKETN